MLLHTTILLLALLGVRQEGTTRSAPSEAPASVERIVWYTSWEQARAEAERTDRPILLQSAAAQCHGVPGMW